MKQNIPIAAFNHRSEGYRRAFNELFEDALSENRWFDYRPIWETLGLNPEHAVEYVKLSPGEVACSACPQGRRILFIGTRFGTVVVFQKSATPNSPLGLYKPLQIGRMFGLDGSVDESVGILIFGSFNNIGKRIETFFNEA